MKDFKQKLISQESLGQILSALRQKKGLKLEKAEEETKVRLRYLKAFEADDFHVLPDEVYAIGFLEKYLDYLSLPKEKYLNQFKRELAGWKSLNINALTPKQTVKQPAVIITPSLMLGFGAVLTVLLMVGYIWYQARHLTAPPQLVIVNPTEEAKVALETIEIQGKTDPGAQVSINTETVSQDRDGNFKEKVALQNGVNTIEIVATNRFNKQNTHVVKILNTKDSTKEEGQNAQEEDSNGQPGQI